MDNYADLPIFEEDAGTVGDYQCYWCHPQQVMLCEDTEKAAEKLKEANANAFGFSLIKEYPNGCRYYDELQMGHAYLGHVYIFRKLTGDSYLNIVLCEQEKPIEPTIKDIKEMPK